MRGKNGFFQLIIKQDGTYLKIFKAEEGGQPISYEEISNYLMDIHINEFDIIVIGKALASDESPIEVKLTSMPILPVDEFLKIEVSEDRMYVKGRFYPPSDRGNLMTKDDIVRKLVSNGIKYGADEAVISDFLTNRKYCTDYILAKATSPVQGHDAQIIYHFNTDLTLKPKTNEDGTVDFHQLDMISHCKKGDLLATLIPVDFGTPGIDVYGNLIKPAKVNNKVLRHGKNIHLSEDGLRMYSDVDGHVTLADGRVFVSDTYEIPADVNTSTGDINYDGNVVVKGNVITGFTVKAKGDIEVYGVVEGAYLEAGGHIILRRGMQGMNRGVLKANGNIVSKFIENSQVIAGGNVTTETILHSKVSAKGEISVSGRRGLVTGGEIRSGTMITVKTAGSQMGTATLLEVGIDPTISDEFKEIEIKIAMLQGEKEKIAQAFALFKKRLEKGAQITEDKKELLRTISQNNIKIEEQLKQAKARYEELKIEMETNTSGAIKVQDTIYPGTKLIIGNVVYFVRNEIQHSKFVRDRADVKVIPL